MANLKQSIEDSMLTHSGLLWLFKEFRGFDESKSKHLKVKSEKVKSEADLDVDKMTITLESDEEIVHHIHVKSVMRSVFNMEDSELKKGIEKALFLESKITEDSGIWTAEISFLLINAVEKTALVRDSVSAD